MNSTAPIKLTLTTVVAALALGCQATDEGDEQELLAQDSISCDPSIDGGVVEPEGDAGEPEDDSGEPDDAGAPDDAEPDPDDSEPIRPFYASVMANGTGCPKGTWTTEISPDGHEFSIAVSKFEASVEDGKRVAFADCNLTIKLHSTDGLSFAVTDFYNEGYAFLEEGVRAFQTSNYYFQGNPVPSIDKEKRTDLTGPVDRTYLFQDTVRSEDAVWSPCGLDRNLQVVMRVGLQKNQDKGAGYISIEKIRGPRLSWKKC